MTKEERRERLTEILARFTGYAAIHLPDDVAARLAELRKEEDSPMAKVFYDAMFDDLERAAEKNRPCCQDTGVIQYFIRAGAASPLLGDLEECLREAVKRATKETPLRHNCVQIFEERNTGDNTGYRIPWIDWEIVPERDDAEIWMYMAGGGCSLPGKSMVLMPLDGYEGVMRYVFDQIASYGVNACPPLLVGIGIAGSAEVAAKLSKKALLRPVGSHNSDPAGAELEQRIEDGLNHMGLGPGGITGEYSVMGVNIEQAGRHPSTLAVGLSTGCWAHRRAHIRVNGDLSYEVLSHQGVTL